MANYVKGEFTGLFVSSIKFLPQSALLEAPSHLQRPPPPIHFNPQTFKVRQTGPFVSSPGGPGLLEAPGSILSLGSGIFPKFWTVACNSSLREKPVPWGRVGKALQGEQRGLGTWPASLRPPNRAGRAWQRSPIARPARQPGPQRHSGLLAWNSARRVSPQAPNLSLLGYFRFVLNKRSRFKKRPFSSCVCNSHAFSLITFNVWP